MVFDLTDAMMGLLGGLLIGCAAALMLLGAGRIAGISGIVASVVPPRPGRAGREAMAFIAGLVAAPAAYAAVAGAPDIGATTSVPLLVAGGLLVGFGTRLGSGCTSGHGVCGISRLSPRSLVATGIFMGVAAAVVALMHVVRGA